MPPEKSVPRRRRRKPVDDGRADAAAIANTPTQDPPKGAAKTRKVSRVKDPADPFGEAAPKTAPKELFQSAPGQASFPKAPDMQRGFQTIVKDLFASGFDVQQEWTDIRDGLVIKDALTPGRLKQAANEQEALADRAHQLYIVGKVEVNAYMRETEAVYGAIRNASTQKLEQEKANKTRTKMITEADVVAEAARLYPDEWSDICSRRERAEAMLTHLQNLAALAKSRCYTVSNMMAPGNRSV